MSTTQKYSTDMLKRIGKALQEAEHMTDSSTGTFGIAVALIDAFNANDLVVLDAKKDVKPEDKKAQWDAYNMGKTDVRPS